MHPVHSITVNIFMRTSPNSRLFPIASHLRLSSLPSRTVSPPRVSNSPRPPAPPIGNCCRHSALMNCCVWSLCYVTPMKQMCRHRRTEICRLCSVVSALYTPSIRPLYALYTPSIRPLYALHASRPNPA